MVLGAVPSGDVASADLIADHTYNLTVCSDGSSSVKCYEDYRCITDTTSAQYQLQQRAYTDKNGLRKVGEYYCVAMGSYFGTEIGTRYEVELKSGASFRVILADQKADADTCKEHIHDPNGAILEFVVDTPCLPDMARTMGSIDYIKKFRGEIKSIRKE